jgi:DNA-binding transcriptional regulator GbsR (MarR family)
MDEINKSNFNSLLKDYKKMSDEVVQAKHNNTILTWVKDDKIENLQDLENTFNEIMDYHTKLIEFFSSSVELEKVFYCGE